MLPPATSGASAPSAATALKALLRSREAAGLLPAGTRASSALVSLAPCAEVVDTLLSPTWRRVLPTSSAFAAADVARRPFAFSRLPSFTRIAAGGVASVPPIAFMYSAGVTPATGRLSALRL